MYIVIDCWIIIVSHLYQGSSHDNDDSLEHDDKDGEDAVDGDKPVGAVGVQVDDEEGDKL